MKTLTREQAAIVSAYTGYILGSFDVMHEYIEKVMGRPVFTHELASPEVHAEIQKAVKSDFVALNPEVEL